MIDALILILASIGSAVAMFMIANGYRKEDVDIIGNAYTLLAISYFLVFGLLLSKLEVLA